jgi:fructuronate reductase
MVPVRLSDKTLPLARPRLERPAYDRSAASIGVVHFGPGAFHRAHQAYAFDRLLAGDPRFGICAASLRSDDLRQALEPQDGLYVLAQRDAEPRFLAIGSLLERVTAPRQPSILRARLADPAVRLVTSTVTEKGYCLDAAGELDLAHPDIVADLSAPAMPRSLVGWLVQGYADRRAAGLPAFLAAPCDNLPGNGDKLRNAVVAFAARRDPELARWIAGEAHFACTMVDSITPATDDALRTLVETECGLTDAWPVQREAFVQWVVQQTDAPGQPDWSAAGVTLTTEVSAFERAKLRLLNGAHSALAYLGLLAGHDTVAEAVGNPTLRRLVTRMWAEEIAPGLSAPPGLDLGAYQQDLLRRFENPVLVHLLAQIAWDGSQKVPVRLLGSLRDAAVAGRPYSRLALAVAAWMMFIGQRARAGVAIVDPLAELLTRLGQVTSPQPDGLFEAMVGLEQVFPSELIALPGVRPALRQAFARLAELGPLGAIADCEDCS